MKQRVLTALLFLIPVLVSVWLHYVLGAAWFIDDLIENVLFALLLFSISQIMRSGRKRLIFLCVAYLLLSLGILTELVYFYLLKGIISESTIYILLEVSAVDASEFLSTYFDGFLIIVTLLLLSPIPLIFWFFAKLNSKNAETRSNQFLEH